MVKLSLFMLTLSLGLQYAFCQDLFRTLLTNEPAATGAACLDGSSPGYYLRRGTGDGANKWLLHLIGGGWCNNTADCYDRSQTLLGSSDFWLESDQGYALFSSNPELNPDFYNWNVALFIYCDGSSFAGDRNETETFQGQTLYYRGYRNLRAIIQHLNDERRMSEATDVILTGCSAGGVGVFIHADYVRTLLSDTVTRYSAFPDAGYFVDFEELTGSEIITDQIRSILTLHNIDDAITPDCKSRYTGEERWRCFFGPYTYEFIRTPIFVLNSQYDSDVLLGLISCVPPGCSEQETDFFLRYKALFDTAAQPLLSSPPTNGYFLESCLVHCHTFENDDVWNVYAINGTTIAQSFGDWYFNRSNDTRLKDCDWPCNPTCPRESGAIKNIPSPYLVILVVLSLCKMAAFA